MINKKRRDYGKKDSDSYRRNIQSYDLGVLQQKINCMASKKLGRRNIQQAAFKTMNGEKI